jgi:hypothetical protein
MTSIDDPWDYGEPTPRATTAAFVTPAEGMVPAALEIPELRSMPLQHPDRPAGVYVAAGEVNGREVVDEHIRRRLVLEQHPVYHLIELVAGGMGKETSQLLAPSDKSGDAQLISSASGIPSAAPVNQFAAQPVNTAAAAAAAPAPRVAGINLPADTPNFSGFKDPHTQLLYMINSSDFNQAKLEAIKMLFDQNRTVAREYIERPENSGWLFYGPVFKNAYSSAIAKIMEIYSQATGKPCPQKLFTMERFAVTQNHEILQNFADLCWRTVSKNRLENPRTDQSQRQAMHIQTEYTKTLEFFRRVKFDPKTDDYVLSYTPPTEANKRIRIEDLRLKRWG